MTGEDLEAAMGEELTEDTFYRGGTATGRAHTPQHRHRRSFAFTGSTLGAVVVLLAVEGILAGLMALGIWSWAAGDGRTTGVLLVVGAVIGAAVLLAHRAGPRDLH